MSFKKNRTEKKSIFRPVLLDALKGYSNQFFLKDIIAGVIVGIVALPLAIAFAIASGVSPEKGLFTAIIAGFVISVLGGSRVQIGGPTGAFIVIVYGIVQQFGIQGLILATFLAGIMLILMGVAGLGNVIRFIPYPLITGFTTGIAVIIFSSQVKDLLGLKMGTVPADFIGKWSGYAASISSLNIWSLVLGITTLLIVFAWPKITRKVPGSLVAIVVTTLLVSCFRLPVETVGSRFGHISSGFPHPALPSISFSTIQHLIGPAFTIALLGGIESLLSAVVADGMTGRKHRSNTELIAQGAANICSSLFGGIPATGAIARTATNIKSGGSTPVAGIVHAITLLVIMLAAGKWAALIPMATLAGILVVVAYNMSELATFKSILKGPGNDAAVLIITFLLTVFTDLTVAIEIGMVLATFLFLRSMIQYSSVQQSAYDIGNDRGGDEDSFSNFHLPKGVDVFEINGPLFFGAAYKFKDATQFLEGSAKVLIVRMRNVPIVDATGIRVLREILNELEKKGARLILSEVTSHQVLAEIKKARLLFQVGKANVTSSFAQAVKRAGTFLA